MAKCDPFYFQGISEETFLQISKELASKGFPLSGPSGQVHGPFGIVLDYSWDASSQSLSVEVLEKSFLVSCNQIRKQLTEALKNYVNTR